jgi:hypothetical protein
MGTCGSVQCARTSTIEQHSNKTLLTAVVTKNVGDRMCRRLRQFIWPVRASAFLVCVLNCGERSSARAQCVPDEIASFDLGGSGFTNTALLFGQSISATPNLCVVGAPLTIIPGGVQYYGSVHLLGVSAHALSPITSRTSPPSVAPTFYGSDVSIDGTVVAVSSPGHVFTPGGGVGAVFIYDVSGSALTLTNTIVPPPQLSSATSFGYSIDVDGDSLYVGVPSYSAGMGAVALYKKQGGAWQFSSLILPPGGMAGDGFGSSVSASGGRCAIGSYGDDIQLADQGSVYVYDESVGSVGKIDGPQVQSGRYGYRLALEDDLLGICGKDGPTANASGLVDLLRFNGTVWAIETQFQPLKKNYYFGAEIDLCGERLAIVDGVSPSWGMSDGVDVYESNGSGWKLVLRARSSTMEHGSPSYPSSVALTDSRLIVGLPTAAVPVSGNTGRVALFPNDSGLISYGSNCPGAGGVSPVLAMNGCAISGNDVSLAISGGVGGAAAVVLFGLDSASIDVGHGCLLQIVPTLPPTLTVALEGFGVGVGSISVNTKLPDSLPLFDFTLQAFCADVGAPLGFSATNGIEVSIQY